jgi:vitamin B12 transport system ATP-binding protein
MPFLMQLQDVEAAGRLAPFSAAFRAGEIVHLVGPNGAGKSTLLARMAGLSDGPGTVHFNGRRLDEWPAQELARRRGYLSQHQTPPFAMPVWHYLALHMQQQGDSARLSDIAAKLGLDNKLGRPGQSAVGRRVAARAAGGGDPADRSLAIRRVSCCCWMNR